MTGDIWLIPDRASQMAGVLIAFLGAALFSLYITTRRGR